MTEMTAPRPWEGRRARMVKVAGPVMVDLFTQGNTILAEVVSGLPVGARLIWAWGYDDVLHLVFEHPSWEVLDDGAEPPLMDIALRALPPGRGLL